MAQLRLFALFLGSGAEMFQRVPRVSMLFFERCSVLLVFIELLFQPPHLLVKALGPQFRLMQVSIPAIDATEHLKMRLITFAGIRRNEPGG